MRSKKIKTGETRRGSGKGSGTKQRGEFSNHPESFGKIMWDLMEHMKVSITDGLIVNKHQWRRSLRLKPSILSATTPSPNHVEMPKAWSEKTPTLKRPTVRRQRRGGDGAQLRRADVVRHGQHDLEQNRHYPGRRAPSGSEEGWRRERKARGVGRVWYNRPSF